MKFFLDTANIEEIERINRLGLVDGVTTNPTIIEIGRASCRERV